MGNLVNNQIPIDKMKGHIEIQSGIKLPFVDRVRLIFGCELGVQTELHTQWRVGNYQAYNILLVEEFFAKWRSRAQVGFKRLHERLKIRFNA